MSHLDHYHHHHRRPPQQTFANLLHHLGVLKVLVDRHLEVEVPQCVRQILAVHIRAGPKEETKKRIFQLLSEEAIKEKLQNKNFFLPALERWDVEVLLVEDQSDASLRMIHVVLGRKSCCGHLRVDSAVGSAAA